MKKVKKLSLLLLLCFLTTMMFMPMSVSAAAKLNRKSVTMKAGETCTLKVSGTKKKINWTSSNRNIATVSKKGVVKGIKPGKCTITAKYGKKKLTCKVAVRKAPIISVPSTSYTLTTTAKKNIKVTFNGDGSIWYDNNNTDVVACKWSKKWKGNVTTLTITPKENGTAKVKLYDDENKKKSVTLNITVNVPEFNKDPFEKLGTELKKIGFLYEDAYTIINMTDSANGMVVSYNESAGTICFSMIVVSGSSSSSMQMTLYRGSDKCYIYMNATNRVDAIEVEKTTSRSSIRKYGSIHFDYTEEFGKVMELAGIYEPSVREQNTLNRQFRSFLSICEDTIPGTYDGHNVTVTMKDLFPNF